MRESSESRGGTESQLPTLEGSGSVGPRPGGEGRPSDSALARFESGRVLAARYRVEGLLGRGGMGEVYRASDLKLEQAVALKFLPEELERDEDRLQRLLHEAKIARTAAHPNLCRVYDVAEEEGQLFLSMEFIEGEDLAALLRRSGRLSRQTALAIARQLCAGVGALHDLGILHRDLKPANVMIDERGVVRIADFGLADTAARLRQGASPAGTRSYMAPEQLSAGATSVQSDIYALGLILYELFTGEPAADSRDASGELRPPWKVAPDLEPALGRVILRCLEKNPSQRPPTARAVLDALPGGQGHGVAAAGAQQRADRITAFRAELGELQERGVLKLEAAQLRDVERYHDGLLRDLVERLDVDVTERGKKLTLGMRIASTFGALAFAASVVLFFYRYWGIIPTPAQVTALMALPVLLVGLTAWLARTDRHGYFVLLAGLAAAAAALLNVASLRAIFNLRLHAAEPLIWGAFATILAYAFGLRMLLGLGLLGGLLSGSLAILAWLDYPLQGVWVALSRLDNLLFLGLAVFCVPLVAHHRNLPCFPAVYRAVGAIAVLLAALQSSILGFFSYLADLPLRLSSIEAIYMYSGLVLSGLGIWVGVSRSWRETANVAAAFSVLFLFRAYVAWWWDWMPRWIFFLVVGATAVVTIVALRRLRSSLATTPPEATP